MQNARKNKKLCSSSCRAKHRHVTLAANLEAQLAPIPPFSVPHATNFKHSEPLKEAGQQSLQGIGSNTNGYASKPHSMPGREIGAADLLLEPCETFTLTGCLGEFFGELGRQGTAIAITGKEGIGRTVFALIVVANLSVTGMHVKYLSLQEVSGFSVKAEVEQLEVRNEVAFADSADLREIRRAARLFDAVVVDCYSTLRLDGQELARLKSDFPRTVFVFVHAMRRDGELKGGICNRLRSSALVEVLQDRQRGLLAIMRKSRNNRTRYAFGLQDGELYLLREL